MTHENNSGTGSRAPSLKFAETGASAVLVAAAGASGEVEFHLSVNGSEMYSGFTLSTPPE